MKRRNLLNAANGLKTREKNKERGSILKKFHHIELKRD